MDLELFDLLVCFSKEPKQLQLMACFECCQFVNIVLKTCYINKALFEYR